MCWLCARRASGSCLRLPNTPNSVITERPALRRCHTMRWTSCLARPLRLAIANEFQYLLNMSRFRLNLPPRLMRKPIPAAFADPSAALACRACERHDAPALVIDDLSHAYGPGADVLRGVSLCLHAGEIVSLVGPSGCGKTTTLRLVAGLERLQSGAIQVGTQLAATPDLHLPAEARNVGMMFQDYALFPHLTVAENVAFGLSRCDGPERRARALAAMRDVGLDAYADRNPTTLSGGQQQRVALARALAPRPNVVLLDEPFSGLDAELRRKVRADAIHLLKAAGVGALMVTHDPEEALFMSDRIAVMRDGRIDQYGAPKHLYSQPSSPYVARFFGEINELQGVVHAGVAETPLGPAPATELADGARALVMTRPEHILMGPDAEATGHAVEARVSFARWLGRTALIEMRLPNGQDILVRTADHDWPADGAVVRVAMDPTRAHVFEAAPSDPATVGASAAQSPVEGLAFSAKLG